MSKQQDECEDVFRRSRLPAHACINETMATETFYHYTNQGGMNGIEQSNYIRASGRSGRFGRGVYGTSKGPGPHSKAEIHNNNYGFGWIGTDSCVD
eukprot:Skav235121  [mRNA]  locus=scaffold3581:236858:237145:- [translate_table: standard]